MSIILDDSGDAIRRIDSTPDAESFTSLGWAYWVTKSSDQIITDLSNSGGGDYEAIYYDGSNLSVTSAGTANFASSPATGQWFQWALTGTTAGANSLKGYWRYPGGTWVTAQTTGYNVSEYALTFGCDVYAGYAFLGRFANCKVFNVPLTLPQIEIELLRYTPAFGGCISRYPMLPGATERLRDYQGAVNLTSAGTLTDGPAPPIGWGQAASGLVLPLGVGGAPTHQLEGYQFYEDDNDKDNSTPWTTEDTNISMVTDEEGRLRLLVEAPTASQYQLECAEDGTSNWFKVENPS